MSERETTDKIECRGEREAEKKVDRILDKDPTRVVEVWIDGRLVYRVMTAAERPRRLR